jgi:pimeloyl-ACP methyl ester carboxylesterase
MPALALGLVALFAFILIAGVAYQQIGLAKDARRFPARGRLIDIGGCRLHLDVRGDGSPTVVFEAGIAATSTSWSLVQPEIAKITTTASYDRAWLGWSDPAQGRRDLPQVVGEFEQLLERADVKGPIILVAHSYGAVVARAYQARHGSKVVGIVLIDPMSIGEWNPPSAALRATLDRGIRLSRRGAWLARLGVVRFALRLLASGGRRLPKLIARAGSRRASVFTDRIVRQVVKLRPESWPMIQAQWSNPKCFEGMARYLEALPESAAALAREAAPMSLREVPVVILSAESATSNERAEHEALAQAAHACVQVVPGSGHWIQMDRPEVVVNAIRDIVAQVRNGRSQ